MLEQEPEHETLIEAYADNERDFMARKRFYEQKGHIFPYSSFGRAAESADALIQDYQEKQEKGWGLSFPEIHGLLDDIGFMSEEAQRDLQEEGNHLRTGCASSRPICCMCRVRRKETLPMLAG